MRISAPTSGYLASFNVAGVCIHVHWSFPAAGVVIAFILGDMSAVTTLSAVSAFTLLVLVHEAGHAFFAKRAGCAVHALVITASGGLCFAEPPHGRRDLLLFLSGGLLAQLAAFLIVLIALAVLGNPSSRVGGSFVLVFTVVNSIMFLANLVPSENNDGALILKVLRSHRSGA